LTRGLAIASAAALAIGLAACGQGTDPREAFADSRRPPGLADRFLPPEGWAWGYLQLGDDGPVQRYGVSSPAIVPRGSVLILPDYGETAETWFETAGDLNRAGYTVWVLEGIGQGGSERLSARRDLGHLKSFDGDRRGVRAMIAEVIRPGTSRGPMILMGQGVGALLAARSVEDGALPAGLILSAPPCQRSDDGGLLRTFGFGLARVSGGQAWRAEQADDRTSGRTHDRWRGAATLAWQKVNPDLRMGAPSLDWQRAFADLQDRAIRDQGRIHLPTLLLDANQPASCIAITGAYRRRIAGGGPALELEDDARRGPWLSAIQVFLTERREATLNEGERRRAR